MTNTAEDLSEKIDDALLYADQQAGIGEDTHTTGSRTDFDFVSVNELMRPKQIHWVVKGLIEADTTTLIFGDPAVGKSLLALDIAAHVALGQSWCDRKVTQGSVALIAGEGHRGIGDRLAAIANAKTMDLEHAPIFVSNMPARMTELNFVDEILVALDSEEPPNVIIIDTLHRNLGGGDENSADDIGQFIFACDMLRTTTGAAIIVVHHSGHQEKNRARGSSALRAAVDAEYRVSRESGNVVKVACTKAKDFAEPVPLFFNLEPVDLNRLDEDGDAVTSVILRQKDAVAESSRPRRLSKSQRIAIDALKETLGKKGQQPPEQIIKGSDLTLQDRIAHLDDWREVAYRNGISSGGSDAQRMAFNRAVEALIENRTIETISDYFWINHGENQ
ncbi:MAG: AAA family ATPase [Sedimenticola sp.]